MKSILVDLKNACLIAEENFKANSLSNRTQIILLDMFNDTWPKQFDNDTPVDVILFSQILHDWPVGVGQNLLKKAFELLPPKGVVIVNEKLLEDDRSGPAANAMVSLDMLYWVDGQQYTRAKIEELMLSVGFKNIKQVKTSGYWSIVYGEK